MVTLPVDAIPDLSDVQVIIFTDWSGRGPDLVEDQITDGMLRGLLRTEASQDAFAREHLQLAGGFLVGGRTEHLVKLDLGAHIDGFVADTAVTVEVGTKRWGPLIEASRQALAEAHRGKLPDHLPASEATTGAWKIELPKWCEDQRNQMTGPSDDGELVVKMLNSGAPGVMLDLEDSLVNEWPHLARGVDNIIQALGGKLTYFDKKRDRTVSIQESKTVIWSRPRGLHLNQGNIIQGELTSASLMDVAMIAYQVNPEELKHPLSI
jgi:hypothetical protein